VEVAARFHPDVFHESWRAEAKKLNCALTQDSVKAMREIIGFVVGRSSRREETEFTRTLSGRLRATERIIHEAAGLLETEIQEAVRRTGQFNPEFSEAGGNPNEKEQSAKRTVRV
jgi:hypothetical protein